MTVVAGAVILLALVATLTVLSDDGQESAESSPGDRGSHATEQQKPGMELPPALPGTEAAEVRSLELSEKARTPPPTATLTASDSEAMARLEGRVTYATDDLPATDLQLTAHVTPSSALEQSLSDSKASTTLVTRTDEDGRYSFAFEGAVTISQLVIQAGSRSPTQKQSERRELEAGSVSHFDFQVHGGSSFSGTVFDLKGRPVPGAIVHAWSRRHYRMNADAYAAPEVSLETDNSGAFQLPHLGPDVVLLARAEGMAPHTGLNGSVPLESSLTGLRLVVSKRRDVGGSVRGSHGEDIVKAEVRLSTRLPAAQRITKHEGMFAFGPPPRSAVSKPDGSFLIEGLCQRSYAVSARHDAHREWTGEHKPGDGPLEIELITGLRLTARVTDPTGAPLPGARGRLGSRSGPGYNADNTTADEQGLLSFEGLAPDTGASLSVTAPSHAVHVEQPIVLEEGRAHHVDLTLRAERPLAGVVVNQDGEPVEGATLTVEGDRLVDYGNMTIFPKPTWEAQFGRPVLRTDASGAFAVHNLYDGLFRVDATSPDGNTQASVDVRSGREDLRIVLDPNAVLGVTLTGVARDGVTGLPITERFQISPMHAGAGGGFAGSSYSFEDLEGRFRITGLDEGMILINAGSEGYAPWSAGAREYDEGEHRLDIEFLPTRRVGFHVVDSSGAPVELNLTFESQDGESLMVESGPGSRNSMLRTNEDGKAIAGGLPAARIVVHAKRGWLGPRREYPVDLRAQPNEPIELVYGEASQRTVLLLILSGSPSEPAPVSGTPGWQLGAWLETQIAEGSLRPLNTPVQVLALDEDDAQVASTSLDPAGENAQAYPVPGLESPFVAKLLLPPSPLKLVASAEGHATLQRSWSPDDAEILVLVLSPL